MFKEVRRRQDHTGGGDGDDVTDHDEAEGEGEANGDGKRKKQKKKTVKKARFTKNVLDGFEESVFYPIIDRV